MRRLDARQFARSLEALLKQHPPADVAAAARAYLTQRNASNLLPRIRAALRAQVDSQRVTVETAQPLAAAMREEFTKLIQGRWPRQEAVFAENHELLGGFRLRRASVVTDYSFKTLIRELDETLAEVHNG